MEIKVPELSLVVLIGVSGSGKSTFAQKHFKSTEIISSDVCRGLVSDDENNQNATDDAFDLLYFLAGKRLKNGLLTVIDATNVQRESRKGLIKLARQYHCIPVAIVIDLPEKLCSERNEKRPDRNFGSHVIRMQRSQLRKSLKGLKKEGFRHIHIFKSVEEMEEVKLIGREKLYSNRKDVSGPFDIIGDIHGCFTELKQLIMKLGYEVSVSECNNGTEVFDINHPDNRKLVFTGDLIDRGPDSMNVLRLAMNLVGRGKAFCVPGNHDLKFLKYLNGKNVQIKHGLEKTIEQAEKETEEFRKEVKEFLYSLVSHYLFDGGRLVVAHAGLPESMQGRGSGAVREFCLYGETTGETDEFGLPVRYNWAKDYRGKSKVVYGHTPVPEPEWLNNTINIDTGCVFGGKLTAFRYPEEEIIAVSAGKVYYEPARPLERGNGQKKISAQQEYDDLLDIEDVTGKRIIQTRLRKNITIREENSIAALEVMGRFSVNPKWLIYLPPTMAPSDTSDLPSYLEYPEQAFNYFRKNGINKVVCEEKHMGSRAIVVLCRNEETARERFGVEGEGIGVCYTRTGRSFFKDKEVEQQLLYKVANTLTKSGFWEDFNTEWVCLDTELMPWSAKAATLLKDQYASVGASASEGLNQTIKQLQNAFESGLEEVKPLLDHYSEKLEANRRFRESYRRYCWDINNLDDYKIAPFHIMATEGNIHTDKNHQWHMETIHNICCQDTTLFKPTPYKIVETDKSDEVENAVNWWLELTGAGGEGMVIKPYDFISSRSSDLIQPAIKCRGKEYLRIIYGPEYTFQRNIEKLKSRGLSRKRSLALREFALGIEALERFIRQEPLRRVHESVFGVLALESEEVDPRL